MISDELNPSKLYYFSTCKNEIVDAQPIWWTVRLFVNEIEVSANIYRGRRTERDRCMTSIYILYSVWFALV